MKSMLQIVHLLIVLSALLAGGIEASAADNKVVDSWGKMSAEQFVQSIPRAVRRKEVTQDQANQEAKRRLIETDAVDRAQYGTLNQLVAWGSPLFSDDEKKSVRERIKSRIAGDAEIPAAQLVSEHEMLAGLGCTVAETDDVLVDWLKRHDLAKLTVADLEFFCSQLTDSSLVGDRLHVVWNGMLKPAKQGNYSFSLSPLLANFDFQRGRVRTEMRVWIDNFKAIDTEEQGFGAAAKSLLLDNRRAVPIRVEFIHDRPPNVVEDSHPAIAMLYWQGPGVERQLVPASAVTLPDGKGNGFNAEYKLLTVDLANHETEVATDKRIDSQIDFCWFTLQHSAFRPHRELVSQLIGELTKRYCDPDYLTTRCQQFKGRARTKADDWRRASELMTSAQRQQFMLALATAPGCLTTLSPNVIDHIHQILRAGAEEAGLTLWQAGFDSWPDFQTDFAKELFPQRVDFWRFGQYLAEQHPHGLTVFRDHHLRRDDGSCRLDSAYSISYGNALLGNQDDWAQWLDAQLNDAKITGDRRVNWLIARAHAEELRNHGAPYQSRPTEKYLDGWRWLEEAKTVAETEPMQLRATKEQAVRLFAAGQRERLDQLLSDAETRFKTDTARKEISDWRAQIAKLGGVEKAPSKVTNVQTAEYLQVFKTRAEVAKQNGDTEAAVRYDKLIEQYGKQQK